MIGEFGDNRRVLRVMEQSVHCGPDKHIQRADQRDINQEPRSERLWMKPHFLEQPAAEILQRQNVTAPAANKTPKDQRR